MPRLATSSSPLLEPLEPRTLLAFEAHINFQPANTPIPPGYLADTGQTFKQQGSLSYGWSTPNNHALDRNHPRSRKHQQYDTFNLLQLGKSRFAWEISLPTGLYSIHIAAGDPALPGTTIRIKAENTTLATGQTTKRHRWIQGTKLINVTDGKLTLSPGPRTRYNPINLIDIVSVRNPRQTIQAESYDASSGVSRTGSSINSLDNGDWVRFDNVVFDSAIQSIEVRLGANPDQHARTIEFRLDKPTGPLFGTMNTRTTGLITAYDTEYATITPTPGIHNLYLVFRGPGPIGQIDWIRFSNHHLARVMPLGDSITEGSGDGHDSYRHWIWHNIEDAGLGPIDYVGTNNGVRPGSGFPWSYDFDWDHEGHSGWRADEILRQLDKWLTRFDPEIVLLHLGTNDLIQRQSPSSTAAEISEVIDKLRAHRPGIIILLAQIVPSSYVANSIVQDYNARLATLAHQKTTKKSPIHLIDQYTGFNLTTHTYDGVHPNHTGEQLIASKWFATLRNYLD